MNLRNIQIKQMLLLITAITIGSGLLKTALVLTAISIALHKSTIIKKIRTFRRENIFFIITFLYFISLIAFDKNSFISIYNLKTRLHFSLLSIISLIVLDIPENDKDKRKVFLAITFGAASSFLPMLIKNFYTLRCDLTYFINYSTQQCDHVPDGSFYFLILTLLLTIPNILRRFSMKTFVLSTITYITAFFWGSRTGYYSIFLALILMIAILPKKEKIKSFVFLSFYFLLNYPINFLVESFNKHIIMSPLYNKENYALFNHSIINKMRVLGLGLNGRKELWVDGFKKIVFNPMGDFIPSPLINFGNYQTFWFHNLWIDTAARSGLIPLVLLLLIGSWALYKIFDKGSLRSQSLELFPLIMIMAISSCVVVYDRSTPLLFLYLSLCFLITTTKKRVLD